MKYFTSVEARPDHANEIRTRTVQILTLDQWRGWIVIVAFNLALSDGMKVHSFRMPSNWTQSQWGATLQLLGGGYTS